MNDFSKLIPKIKVNLKPPSPKIHDTLIDKNTMLIVVKIYPHPPHPYYNVWHYNASIILQLTFLLN